MTAKLILVIDDEESILNMLEDGLELHGNFEIEVSQTSKEFKDLVHQIKYDVLLIDNQMPNKTGSELATDLRANEGPNQKTPIIFISGQIKKVKEETKNVDSSHYLSKPIKFEELSNLIDKITQK
jgi:DNA-binding response OmpR family regulator